MRMNLPRDAVILLAGLATIGLATIGFFAFYFTVR